MCGSLGGTGGENTSRVVQDFLNRVVIVASLIGLAGIGCIALDRLVLSEISNTGYAELLRCAPSLVEIIEVKRTPLLYLGYLAFSFGFVSLVLFILRGEEITGWASALAQLSILSPIGYAVLYSGRMPMLLIVLLIVSAMLVRVRQGRSLLPLGHHLVLKMVAFFLLFAVYSSAMWSSRQNFCVQMSGIIRELLDQQVRSVNATKLSKMIDDAKIDDAKRAKMIPILPKENASIRNLQEAWHVKPRAYLTSAIDSGILSPSVARGVFSTYFYMTHGVRILDTTWRAREKFSPQWGIYEIGILSPIFRVFFPNDPRPLEMERQLKSVGIYGFFPTAWAAAFIDFGIFGAIIYVLVWGFVAGLSASCARRFTLVTPALLLVFTLTTILLSPVQGPLGVANSALVLLSTIITGLAIDLAGLRDKF